jgi:predicted aspartyl protease
MSADMGTFRIAVEIENPLTPGPRITLHSVLVDTGAELSWFPASALESLGIQRRTIRRFRQATGAVVERSTGLAFVHVNGVSASDDVVFGEPDDIVLLGARSLEGMNVRVDPVAKILVDAGPMPAAATA